MLTNPVPLFIDCLQKVHKKIVLSLDLSIDLWYNNNAGESTPTT